ncbi:hypothetical protein PVAP13_3KG470501 [Panicum virgatum]|uniref:Uncharacterized protein n=1 Tax=Panicum virgatum TaxID=38727 RepID=A0A8T0V164_PANVG|nr:hypothetical protein PVAP13_3KG470501 [Panicum virgatum]
MPRPPCREIPFSGGGAPRIPLAAACRQRPSPSPGATLPPRGMEPTRDRSGSSTRAWRGCARAGHRRGLGGGCAFRGGAREGKSRARNRRRTPPAADSPRAPRVAAVPIAVNAHSSQLHLLHTVVDLAPPRTCSLNERGSPASRTVAAEGRTTTAMARAISSTTSTHPRRCPPSTRTSKPHHWCAARRG